MADEEKKQPGFGEDVAHVLINELAPSFVNGFLDHLPRDMYEKLIQNSDWIRTIEPILSTLILRTFKGEPWADSLSVSVLARFREEIGKRAKGETGTSARTGTGTDKNVHPKKEQERRIDPDYSTVKEILPLICKQNHLRQILTRIDSLPEEKKKAFLKARVKKDKAGFIFVQLLKCEEVFFPTFIDLLIDDPEEPEPEPVIQISFIEEVINCPHFVAYFSSLPKEKRIVIKRHIEHIPLERRRERLNSLNAGSQDDFNGYVATVIAAREYWDLDKLLPSLVQQVKDFFDEVHEKRKRQGGFFAGLRDGYKGKK